MQKYIIVKKTAQNHIILNFIIILKALLFSTIVNPQLELKLGLAAKGSWLSMGLRRRIFKEVPNLRRYFFIFALINLPILQETFFVINETRSFVVTIVVSFFILLIQISLPLFKPFAIYAHF